MYMYGRRKRVCTYPPSAPTRLGAVHPVPAGYAEGCQCQLSSNYTVYQFFLFFLYSVSQKNCIAGRGSRRRREARASGCLIGQSGVGQVGGGGVPRKFSSK